MALPLRGTSCELNEPAILPLPLEIGVPVFHAATIGPPTLCNQDYEVLLSSYNYTCLYCLEALEIVG